MRIRSLVYWITFTAVYTMNAQDNFSINFSANTKPTETIKSNDYNLGLEYNSTFNSNYKMDVELAFNSKCIDLFSTAYSNSLTDYNEIRSKFSFSYLKNERMSFGFAIEPYVASENKLEVSDIDFLGEFNSNFILSANKTLAVGISRNNIFGKTSILPTLSFKYDYSENLNLMLGFPETKVSFSNNDRNVFHIRNVFNGSVYQLEDTNILGMDSSKASFSQLSTALEYERKIEDNWFLNFKSGYDFNRKMLLLDKNDNTVFDYKIKGGYNFGITIKYKY